MSKRRTSYLLLSLASSSVASGVALPACSGSDVSDNKTPANSQGGSVFPGVMPLPPGGDGGTMNVITTGIVVMPPGGMGPCGGGVCGSVVMPPGGAGGEAGSSEPGGGPCCPGVVIMPPGGAGAGGDGP